MNKQFKTDAQDFLNSVQVLREVQTPESENHMYDELMQVKFLMPVVIHGELKEGADGKQILDEKRRLRFHPLRQQKAINILWHLQVEKRCRNIQAKIRCMS